jgi:multidrug efflux pump subunit AcrB
MVTIAQAGDQDDQTLRGRVADHRVLARAAREKKDRNDWLDAERSRRHDMPAPLRLTSATLMFDIETEWTLSRLLPKSSLETRLTTPFEKGLTTLVDNIEHIESTTYNGTAVVKIYLQPGASVDRANSQVVALSGFMLRLLPPATQPPEIINFSASSVPVLQLGVSGPGMSEQQLNDLALNFLRVQLITVSGAVIPLPYGGKPRQVMINMDQNLMQAKNVSPNDVLNSVNAQNLILPSGTAKKSPKANWTFA